MFKSIRPETVHELLEALDQQFYYVFAGGTDLMIRKRQWHGAERKFDKDVAFIAHLDELNGIEDTENTYEIYTLVTQSEMADSEILPEYLRVPYSQMATLGVRNIATVGGNIINAASVGDSLPPLYALDAEIVMRNKIGRRSVPIQTLIKDKYKTDRRQNEILEKVIIPKYDATGYFYKKLGQRKASILAKLSVFAVYKKVDGTITDVRIVVGAVNDLPIRLPEAEKALVKTANVDAYLETLAAQMNASTDRRSTKDYREKTALNLVKHFLDEIFEKGGTA
jgi:CO/xanthine dehydrogenase FAD-binding subunit